MLHRFPAPGSPDENPSEALRAFRSSLSLMKRAGYVFVSLSEMLDRLERGSPALHKAICFTVDDGYSDFYDVASPVFQEFGCPATVFLVTGFLDRITWLWWDQLQFIFERKDSGALSFEMGGRPFQVSWSDERSRSDAVQRTAEGMKAIPDLERRRAMAVIAQNLGVTLPPTPPPEHAPLTWDQVRELGGLGFTFGPHSVTHPILSRMDDAGSCHEIEESWARLRAETSAVVPVFAYPNGCEGDFSSREQRVIRDLGLRAALTAREDYVMARDFSDEDHRFALPRFGFPEDVARGARIVTGITRIRLRWGGRW